MSFVLADTHGWLKSPASSSTSSPASSDAKDAAPFEILPLQTFENLREAVNSGKADFFMWEHFTSKRYYDNGSIKKIGEIYTPWPSWHIVAHNDIVQDSRLEGLFEKLNRGIKYFESHQEEAVQYISTELDYSAEIAREWLGTVRFAGDVRGVSEGAIGETVKVLEKAGVLGRVEMGEMIGVKRA
jgi:hypothetical protein